MELPRPRFDKIRYFKYLNSTVSHPHSVTTYPEEGSHALSAAKIFSLNVNVYILTIEKLNILMISTCDLAEISLIPYQTQLISSS